MIGELAHDTLGVHATYGELRADDVDKLGEAATARHEGRGGSVNLTAMTIR